MKISIFIYTFCLFAFSLNAQNMLTLQEATQIALANNFGIKVANNNIEIAQNNTDKRLNGYAPTVNASAGLTGSLGGSNQQFSNGQENSTANALTYGGNAAINANYTIFDKRRDLLLDQLKETVNLSNLQLRQTIETNLLQIYGAYYQIAQLSENVQLLEEALSISNERLRRAQYQLDYGQGTGLAVLNVKVDIQRDSINIINAKQFLINAKRSLNVLMGRNSQESFKVDTEVVYNKDLNIEALLEEAKQQNITLRIQRQNLIINEKNLNIIEAEKKPRITTGASYTFNYSDNPDKAFITRNNSRGLGANIGLTVPLYDATRSVRSQNIKLNLENQYLQQLQQEQVLERDLLNAWDNYQNALNVLSVELAAVAINQENFERTQEQIKVGRLTSLEFRQAQLNLLNAQVSLTNAKFTAKLRELEVLVLVGR